MSRPRPDAALLEKLLLGQLPPEQAEPLIEQLQNEDTLAEAAGQFASSDTLVEALRAQAARPVPPPDARLEGLMSRLAALRAGGSASGDQTQDTGGTPSEAGGATFLTPPRGPDEIGRLGGYRVLRVLGQGGMGVVLLAEDERLRRQVALKVMRPEIAADEKSRERFLREARATAAVEHENVITVHAVGEEGGVPFLVMALLRGESLEARLQREPRLPPAQVLRIGREAAEGLAAAHARGLIHRDVKPSNLWLEGTQGKVKVLDFGLARSGDRDADLTRSGAILGTPAYMAPEQAAGEAVDGRSDLFSLGCVLYQAATGRRPFEGANVMAVLNSLATHRPAPASQLNPAVPPELSGLIMRLMEKDPARRPATAQAVTDELARIAEGLTRATPPAPRPAAEPRPKPRRRWVWPVAALMLLALAGGGAAWWAFGLIKVETPNGTLVIEGADDDVEVTIRKNGALIKDKVKGREVELQVGDYTIELAEQKDGLRLSTDRFTITRGDRTPIKVYLEKGAAKGNFPRLNPGWVKKVQALPPEEQVKEVAAELKRRNPGFDGQVKEIIQDEAVLGLIIRSPELRDLSPVKALPRLLWLTCVGSDGKQGKLTDLTPLQGLQLAGFNCGYNQVADLSPLAGMPLDNLVIDANPVVDLSPVKKMPLTKLSCPWTQVSDLSPLRGKRLTALVCGNGTPVTDLSPLQGMPLEFLHLLQSPVTDLSPLRGLPLKEIHLDFQPGRDAAVLRGIKTLERINDKPAAEFWKEFDAKNP